MTWAFWFAFCMCGLFIYFCWIYITQQLLWTAGTFRDLKLTAVVVRMCWAFFCKKRLPFRNTCSVWWDFLFVLFMNVCELWRIDFCPGVLDVSELALMSFTQSPVKPAFVTYLLCAWTWCPKADSHRHTSKWNMQIKHCRPWWERSVSTVRVSHRSGQCSRATLASEPRVVMEKRQLLGKLEDRLCLSDSTKSSQEAEEMVWTKAWWPWQRRVQGTIHSSGLLEHKEPSIA